MKGSSYHKLHGLRQSILTFDLLADLPDPTEEVREAHSLANRYLSAAAHPLFRFKETKMLLGTLIGPVQTFDVQSQIAAIPETPLFNLPVLPSTYGFKGGAARYLLSQMRGVANMPLPRDLDLVRIGGGWTVADQSLSEKYMPRDFAHGYGVEVCQTLRRYIDSRDLSINEILCINKCLKFSPACLLDSVGWTLRPCRYSSGSLHHPRALSGRTLAKILRLIAMGAVQNEKWTASGIPEQVDVSDFSLALELNKSLACGTETAEIFLRLCLEVGLIENSQHTSLLIPVIRDLALGLQDPLQFFYNLPEEMQEVFK